MKIIRTAFVVWAGIRRAGANEHGDHLRGGGIGGVTDAVAAPASSGHSDGHPAYEWKSDGVPEDEIMVSKPLRCKKSPLLSKLTSILPSIEDEAASPSVHGKILSTFPEELQAAQDEVKVYITDDTGDEAVDAEADVFVVDDVDDVEEIVEPVVDPSSSQSSQVLPISLDGYGEHAAQVKTSSCTYVFNDVDTLKEAVNLYISEACATNPDCASRQTYGTPMNNWCTGQVTDMSYLLGCILCNLDSRHVQVSQALQR